MTTQRIAAAKTMLTSFEIAGRQCIQTLHGVATLAVCMTLLFGLGIYCPQSAFGQAWRTVPGGATGYHGEYSYGENAYDPNGGTAWENREFTKEMTKDDHWYWHGNSIITLTGDGSGILTVLHSAYKTNNYSEHLGNVVTGSEIQKIETLNVTDLDPELGNKGGEIEGGILTDITTVNAHTISGGTFNASTRDMTISGTISGGTLRSGTDGKIITSSDITGTTVVENANFEFRGGTGKYQITSTGNIVFRDTFTANGDLTIGDGGTNPFVTTKTTVKLAKDNLITGTLTVDKDGTLQNGNSQLTVGKDIVNGGNITADGISVTGNVTNNIDGKITVSKDTLDIGGNLINNAVIDAKKLNVTGTITNNEYGTFQNIDNLITNNALTNDGTISNVKNIIVNGLLTNSGTIATKSNVDLVKATGLDNSGTLNVKSVIINGNAKTTGEIDANNININGGTFDISGKVTASNIFASNGITVNNDLTQFRTLTTNGALTVNANQKLSIATGGFASGGTVNNNGTIAVEGTLGSVGRITNVGEVTGSGVINGAFENNTGGVISPGTAVTSGVRNISSLAIKGNFYNNGGIIRIEIDGPDGKDVDLLRVTGGKATINGGQVEVDFQDYMQLEAGTKYVFLDTDRPGDLDVTSDLGSNLVDPMPVMSVRLGRDTQSYWLEIGRSHSYGDISGATPNQRSVGTYLDVTGQQPTYNSAYWNFLARLDAFRDANGDGAAQHALDELSGAIYGTIGTVSVHNAGVVNMTLADTLRSDVFKFSYIGNPNNAVRGQAIAPLRWNRWATGYGIGGESENDGNASGYKQSYGGGIFGMDRAFWTGTRFGVYASGADGTIEMKQLNERTRSRDFMVGLYLRQEMYYGYALASFGFGQDMYKTNRNITFLGETATNKHYGNIGTCYFERGIDLPWRYGTVQPYMNFQIVGVRQEDFTEEGAGVASLQSIEGKTDSFRFAFGTRTSTCPIPTKFAQIAFTSNLTWFHEFATDHDRDFFARLDTQGGTADTTAMFRVLGNDPKQDWINFGWGVHLDRNSSRIFFAGNLYANDRQVLYTGNGGFITSW